MLMTVEREACLRSENGLHVRVAAMLVQRAEELGRRFGVRLFLRTERSKPREMGNLMKLIGLKVSLGDKVFVSAEGISPETPSRDLEQAAEVERCIAEGESYVAADTLFHRLIAEASGNKVFGNLTYVLNTSIAQNIAITQDIQRDSNTIRYHRKIAQAIQEGRANDAASYMNMHLQLLREFVREKMQ